MARQKWFYENCKEVASKYETPIALRRDYPSAYKNIRKNGWIDEFFPERIKQNQVSQWTLDMVRDLSVKNGCKTKSDLNRLNPSLHSLAVRNGWLDDLFGEHASVPSGTWTFEACRAEAAKYKTKRLFSRGSAGAYDKARKSGWLDDICKHMPFNQGALRCVYRIIDHERMIVYIGITCNFESRWSVDNPNNIKNRPDVVELLKTSLYERLTEYVAAKEAANIERGLIFMYRKTGWCVLNKTDGGEIGMGVIKWTYEACKAEAAKYEMRTDLANKCREAYRAACNRGWINDFYPISYPRRRKIVRNAPGQLSLFD